jgi:hypothetical protein
MVSQLTQVPVRPHKPRNEPRLDLDLELVQRPGARHHLRELGPTEEEGVRLVALEPGKGAPAQSTSHEATVRCAGGSTPARNAEFRGSSLRMGVSRATRSPMACVRWVGHGIGRLNVCEAGGGGLLVRKLGCYGETTPSPALHLLVGEHTLARPVVQLALRDGAQRAR